MNYLEILPKRSPDKKGWGSWQKERGQGYRDVLQIDQQENLTPKQKIAARDRAKADSMVDAPDVGLCKRCNKIDIEILISNI
jgi:hypothetical protein